jgi:hypothetical protein
VQACRRNEVHTWIVAIGRDDRFWHDPALVLVGTFAGRRPKPFGAFPTRNGLSGRAPTLVVLRSVFL